MRLGNGVGVGAVGGEGLVRMDQRIHGQDEAVSDSALGLGNLNMDGQDG